MVQLHLRYGMILFIASEVMFFVGWFWAFFDFALFPSLLPPIEGLFPSKDIEVMNAFELPLLNTLILLCSGTTVTWAHHSLIHGDRDGAAAFGLDRRPGRLQPFGTPCRQHDRSPRVGKDVRETLA